MALKQNRTRQTRTTKAAAAGPDNPFTGGGVANSPGKRPGPRSPGGHRKDASRVSRGPAPERKPTRGARRSSAEGLELATRGHAERAQGTRNPPARKRMPRKARRAAVG